MADSQTPTEASLLSTSPSDNFTNASNQIEQSVSTQSNGTAQKSVIDTASQAVTSTIEPVKEAAQNFSQSQQANGTAAAIQQSATQATSAVVEPVREATSKIRPSLDPSHYSLPSTINDNAAQSTSTTTDTAKETPSQLSHSDLSQKPVTSSLADSAASAASTAGQSIQNAAAAVTPKGGISVSITSDETPLFEPSLISSDVAALLPDGYSIRPLKCSDYHKGFLDTLRVLTTVGEPNYETFRDQYESMRPTTGRHQTYYILVILDSSSSVVGTGAVIVERKFIHNMGLVGHIEDIAVAKNQQGKKLGLRIIQALDSVAKAVGCYKCILDCSEANEGFYVKCGFKRAGLEMAHYY